jgi:ATP-binding cassette subfamily B protein
MKRYCSLMLEVLRLGGFPAVALALVMLVNGAMAPLTIWLTQNVIDIGIRQSEQGQTLTPVIPWLIGLVLALVCLNLRELTEMVTMIRLKHRLRDWFNPRVLAKLSRLEYQCFEDTNTVDLISWVGAAPEEGLSQSFHSILFLPNYVVNLAGTALLLHGVAWWTLVGAACLFVPAVLIQMRMGVEGYRLSREQTLTRRKTDYISALITGRTSVKEVRLFQLSDHLQSKWSYLHRQVIDEQFALEARHVQEGHALSLVKIAFMIGSLIAFSIPLYYQKVTTGQFIALSSALSEVMTLAVWSIPYSLSMVKKDILYWNNFDKFMHLPEIPPETRWEHIDNLTRGISFNDVYFKYPNTTKEVLRGVSFRLRPGERVAIVGKNGAGKSTLIKLLLGLYQPDQGSITLDGVNVILIHPRACFNGNSTLSSCRSP